MAATVSRAAATARGDSSFGGGDQAAHRWRFLNVAALRLHPKQLRHGTEPLLRLSRKGVAIRERICAFAVQNVKHCGSTFTNLS